MGKEQPVQSGSADHGEPAVPAVTGASGETATMEQPERVPLFGARRRARQLGAEVIRLRSDLDRLGVLPMLELERRSRDLAAEVDQQTLRLEKQRQEAAEILERERVDAQERAREQLAALETERAALEKRVQELRDEVVLTEDIAMLQEAGVYEYRHPLSDSVAYQQELQRLRDQVKAMARNDGGAVTGSTNWTVNGSLPQGRKMVRDFSKLMLRAYNAEADNLVRGLRPYKLAAAVERLGKVTATIERLGKTMDIEISAGYHRLRVLELQLTADYVQKLAEEKEHERAERDRLREERKAQQEMERERARLEKERQHYLNALQAVEAKGDEDASTRLREQLADIDRAIEDVDYRAANIRAGYVYVISNVGSFGEQVVKIGMTRRLDPLDRVRELGDASVPFRYDVHALFFSDDAVGIEAKMHDRLADRRVNRINTRREFFYATPVEAKTHLLDLAGELLQYEELPEALEFRQSQNLALKPTTTGNVAVEATPPAVSL
jgi:hypothetical protein